MLIRSFLRLNPWKTCSRLIPKNLRFIRFRHHLQGTHQPCQLFSAHSLKPISRVLPFSLKTNGFSSMPHADAPSSDQWEGLAKNCLDPAVSEILKKKLENLGMDTDICIPGQYNHLLCPICKGGDSEEKSLSIFVTEDGGSALWMCFRAKCGWKGSTTAVADSRSSFGLKKITKLKNIREITLENLQLEPLCDELVGYLAERSITEGTLQRNGVMQKRYGDQIAIAFTYWRNKKLVGCKYRDVNKKFWQEADTEKIFYGLDDIHGKSEIIIVEGEMDKLAMEEAGFCNCVSVPDGAPPSVSSKELPPEEKDAKYQYLWNCKEYLQQASRIILATDGDPPGQALAEELARRLGRERCWRVKWPKKNEVDHFKDANEVVPGELTIVTGVPNSGKSEWIDALLCNLNESTGWKFALCSMENKVRDHARKLLEKHIKKPFFNASYGGSAERMTVEDLENGKQWLSDTFYLIRCEDDSLPNIKWVLDLARAAVLRHGVRGLVIDPYNEIDHQRSANQTETEYVSQMLTKIKRFAQHHSCHVWFVAHPRQLHQWVGGPPNMYDISGSAHFINKCDNGIVIHRNRDPEAGPLDRVQVCVRKVRNKVAGTVGDAFLSYNRVTGEFVDLGLPSVNKKK